MITANQPDQDEGARNLPNTALAFLLLFVFGLVLALFVRPMYGLYTYVAVFYLHPPSRWWGGALPDIRWSLTAAAVTLIAVAIHRRSLNPKEDWTRSTIVRVLLIFTIWMWVQLPWVVSSVHWDGVVLFSKYVVLLYLIYTIIDNENDFRGFCLIHILGCTYLGLLIYLATDTGRLDGIGGPGINDANNLGMQLSTGLIFAAFMIMRARGWTRWVVFAAIPFILNGIIQTETRGAIIGLFLGGLVTVYLKPAAFRKQFYILSVFGALAFILLANTAFLARMGSMTAAVAEEEEWDTSAASRVAIVKSQFRMFLDYPLGAGHQGTAYLSRNYIEEKWWANSGDRASHNTVMSILVDQGIPGILLFGALAVAVLRTLKRLKHMDRYGLSENFGLYRCMVGGAIVSIIGSGMFAQNLKAEVQIWCLILLVVLCDLSKSSIAENNGDEPKVRAP